MISKNAMIVTEKDDNVAPLLVRIYRRMVGRREKEESPSFPGQKVLLISSHAVRCPYVIFISAREKAHFCGGEVPGETFSGKYMTQIL